MDIPRYRIGNDLTVLWAISNNDGTPYDLSGKEVRLYVTNERGMSRVEPSIVQDENSSVTNIIRWVFLGDNQKVLGKHTLTVEILTSDEHRKIKRDICDAFTLVSRSEDEETGGEGNALDSGAIYLSTKLDVYRFGNVRVEIGTNGNWFIDGTDTGRSALAGEKGIVNKIYQASDLGKDFDTSSVVDTFNAQAINEVYKGLKNLTIKELRDLSLADLEEYDVLTFNGQKWLNFPFRELINIFKLSVDISDDDNDPEEVEQYWYRGYDGKVHIDDDIVVHGNAIIEGDTASGGAGEDITVGLDEQAVLDLLEREKYVTEDDIAGLVPEVDLSDYYKATQVDDLLSKKANTEDVYTKTELADYKAWWDKVMSHLTVDDNGDVTIDTNLIVSGDTASGGAGEDITVGLDEQAVLDLLKEKGYVTEKDIAGLIPDDYVNSAELTEIVNEINAKIAKKADSSALQNLQNEVDNIEAVLGMDEEAEGIINTWNEVKAFLDGYSSSDDLAAILSSMNADIAKRALKSELEALGLIVDGHTSSISTINGSINAINGSINALSGRVGTNEGNISNLLTRMSAEETVTNTYKDWWENLKKYISVVDGNVQIDTNLIVSGDTASGGAGEDIVVGIQGVKVNNTKYNDSGDGYVDLTDAFNSIDVSGELANYYTKDEVNGKISNFATTDALTSGLSVKVDKVTGKALSTNDFTDALLTKLNGIADGAEVNVQSDWNATSGDAFIKNKPTIPTNTNQLDNGAGFITSSALNGYAKTTDIPTLTSLMGATAIGGTTSYIYWNGSAWATKTLGDRAFDSTAYQPLATAINTGNIGSYAVLLDGGGTIKSGSLVMGTATGGILCDSIYPRETTTSYNGQSSRRWSYLFAKDGNFSGNLVVSGDVASGGAGQDTTSYLPLSGGNVDWLTIGGYSAIHDGNIASYCPRYDASGNISVGGSMSILGPLVLTGTEASQAILSFPRASANYIIAPSGGTVNINVTGSASVGSAQLRVSSSAVYKGSSATVDLGTSSSRWVTIYGGKGDFSGAVTQGSDIRFKHKMNDVTLDLDVMANAPLFNFYWNDRPDNQLHLGTSAQYWEIYRNELVSGTDFKGLDYSTLGVAMGISLAKKVKELEAKIKYIEERYGEVCE